MQTLQKLAPRHPQIAQRKQRYQVGRVFGQATALLHKDPCGRSNPNPRRT